MMHMWVWGIHMFGKVYTFCSVLALNSTHNICEASNLTSTFVLMLIVIFLSFIDWRHGWGGVLHMWVWGIHMFGKVYTFCSVLALNSTHNICEASNLTSTFVLMLIVIFLSFIDWQHGWGGVLHMRVTTRCYDDTAGGIDSFFTPHGCSPDTKEHPWGTRIAPHTNLPVKGVQLQHPIFNSVLLQKRAMWSALDAK